MRMTYGSGLDIACEGCRCSLVQRLSALLLSCLLLMATSNLALAIDTAVAPAAQNHLLIVGSSTIAPLIEDLGNRFRSSHPNVTFTIEKAGSGHGAKDTLSGRADIGMVARPLKPKEKALFVIPIARDGAALVINKNNPVNGLTREKARGIFSGQIDNWKSLAGPSRPIALLSRGKAQGVTTLVAKYLDLPAGEMIFSKEVVLNDKVIDGVVTRPDTLSFLSIGVLEQAVEDGAPLKALALDGIPPSSHSIRDGSWPMTRSLTLVTRSVPKGLAKEFIQYILLPGTRAVIKANGFIPY